MIFREAEVLASIVRESFAEFVKEFWEEIVAQPLQWNWHMDFLCEELQTVAERVEKGLPKEYDLCINVPPGTSKSTIISQLFPAWCWTRMPSGRFICGSYALEIALKDSLATRDVVLSDKYQASFPMQMRDDENRKGRFVNDSKGDRFSCGVGGRVTGMHGHYLIVDDPLNPEEAFSTADLKTANRWMTQTLPLRKVDKLVSVMILVMQRLAQEDPSGKMIERKGVRHICLPGEETNEIEVKPKRLRKHYKDGLLDPVRMPWSVLKEAQEILGAYGYAGQILQSPVPLEGGLFKTKKLIRMQEAPKMVCIWRSWDKAGTQGGGKWTAGVLMGQDTHGKYWILDVERGQWDATHREEIILETAIKDGRHVRIALEIEGGSGGKESAEGTVGRLAGYRVEADHPTGDKMARAYQFASQVGGGNVYVLERGWTDAYIDELKFFAPGCTYSDQVDASSQAFNKLMKKRRRVGGAWVPGQRRAA